MSISTLLICANTMHPCQTPGMCAPHGGCRPPAQTIQMGWKCPVCGKGNAPFQKLCANAACGIDFTASAISKDQTK